MLAVPYQQPPSVCRLPPVGVLAAIERIQAVRCVDIHIEKDNAGVKHGVPLAHGNAVDVSAHGRAEGDALRGKALGPGKKPVAKNAAVNKIGKVQIAAGKTDPAAVRQLGKLGTFPVGCLLQKALHAEKRLAVPAEALILRLLHPLDDGADKICLPRGDGFLKIGITDVGVRMMDKINGTDVMVHTSSSAVFNVVSILRNR